jgi:hypothetical protein
MGQVRTSPRIGKKAWFGPHRIGWGSDRRRSRAWAAANVVWESLKVDLGDDALAALSQSANPSAASSDPPQIAQHPNALLATVMMLAHRDQAQQALSGWFAAIESS